MCLGKAYAAVGHKAHTSNLRLSACPYILQKLSKELVAMSSQPQMAFVSCGGYDTLGTDAHLGRASMIGHFRKICKMGIVA